MKRIVFLILLLSCSGVFAQKAYSFKEVDSLLAIEKRPVVIFIHTDYCKYCLAMESKTLQDPEIGQTLDTSFYFVKLNGEERRAIRFKKHVFKYKPTGNNVGVHELAEALGTVNGTVSYPTICILNTNYEIVFQHNEYIKKGTFLKILTNAKIK